MARISVSVSDSLQKMLGRCAEIDRIAPLILSESVPLVVDSVKKRLEPHSTAGTKKSGITYRKDGSTKKYYYTQTGDLRASVAATKPKKSKNGWSTSVGFEGEDKKGVSNSLKANQLEHGNSRQPPTPFLAAARNDCEKAVRDKQQEVFEREAGIK